MGLRDILGALRASTASAAALADGTRIVELVPAAADYVSLGAVRVLPDARRFVGAAPGSRRLRHPVGSLTDLPVEPTTASLLVLAAGHLRVVTADGEVWSAPIGELTDLDAHQAAGFVIMTTRSDGLLVGPQRPVAIPPGAHWRTVPRTTNVVSGWDAALKPHGVRVHF